MYDHLYDILIISVGISAIGFISNVKIYIPFFILIFIASYILF